jgi:hypothetical protein
LKLIIDEYQAEYNKRMAAEAKKVDDNPLLKNSMDIG